jgi:hypothetical protein
MNPSPVTAPRRSAPAPVRWRSWPIAEGGRAIGSLAALGAVVIAVVALTTWNIVWSLVAAGLLAAAAWRSFVPIDFEVSAQGITQEVLGRRRRISWKSIAVCEVCRAGVWLSPTAGRRSFFAGLYLPWGARRNEILALFEYYLPPAA